MHIQHLLIFEFYFTVYFYIATHRANRVYARHASCLKLIFDVFELKIG